MVGRWLSSPEIGADQVSASWLRNFSAANEQGMTDNTREKGGNKVVEQLIAALEAVARALNTQLNLQQDNNQ